MPYDQAPTRDETITWFEKGSTDVTGTADSSQRANRYMIWWMGRIENALGGDGFAVGSKMSLADIMLYYYFAEVLTDPESPAGFPLFKREPFGDIDRTQAAVARHPRIAASIAAVKANTNFQKWLTIHGPQEF